MGNVFGAPASALPQPPARAVDNDPEQERRQVYREAFDGRAPMEVLRRRRVRALVLGAWVNQPVTLADQEELRSVVLVMLPECSSNGECAVTGDARVALAIVESLNGYRSLSQEEATYLAEFLTDDKPVYGAGHTHPRLTPPARWSTCDCTSPTCAECNASPFRRVPRNISALDIHFKSAMSQEKVLDAESHADVELF